MLISLDTETTGLDLLHGCRPFFISTWWSEHPSLKTHHHLENGDWGAITFSGKKGASPTLPRHCLQVGCSRAPYGRIRSSVHLPLNPDTGSPSLEGYGYNWLLPYHPSSREVRAPESLIHHLGKSLENTSIVFHNAFFDLSALATIGLYFNFENPAYSSLTLRDYSPLGPDNPFPEPVYVVNCKDFHDTTLACHTYDSKGPRGLKDAAAHYLLISSSDEKTLKEEVGKVRDWVNKNTDWKTGKNLKGETQTEYDYALPIALQQHDLCGIYKKQNGTEYDCPPIDPTTPIIYGSLDAYRTLGLHYVLTSLNKREDRYDHYLTQLAQLPTCFKMQACGVSLSEETQPLYTQLSRSIFARKKQIVKTARLLAPKLFTSQNFNPNSPTQLGKLLHSKEGLNLPVLSYTETKTPCVNVTNRRTLAERYLLKDPDSLLFNFLKLITSWDSDDPNFSFPEENVGYDSWTKAKGYLNSYLRHSLTNPSTSVRYVFPLFNPVGTDTTRYSSGNPNGQNISKKTSVPLRRAFGPPPGKIWAAIDYSQLELRLFAGACQDETLLSAFENDIDFHAIVACEMFDLPPEEISSTQRRAAKAVNFGIIYGAGEYKIDLTAGFKGAYAKYRSNFPAAVEYMERTARFAEQHGYVETLYGYPLQLGGEPSYKGVNYVVQGTAGQIVKYAMMDLDTPTSPIDWSSARLILNVHDELLFELDAPDTLNPPNPTSPLTSHLVTTIDSIMAIMASQGDRINVTTPVDCGIITSSWMEKVSYDKAKEELTKAAEHRPSFPPKKTRSRSRSSSVLAL